MSHEIVRRIRRREDGVVQIIAGPPPAPVESRLTTVVALVAGCGAFIAALVAVLLKLAPFGPARLWI